MLFDYYHYQFQSTLPRRERPGLVINDDFLPAISIHAPEKGATGMTEYTNSASIFQSTLPRRERRVPDFTYDKYQVFQSTLPRRERRTLSVYVNGQQVFQSTLPRRERPSKRLPIHITRFSFQSTLPRRERRKRYARYPCTQGFQSTLPRRERLPVLRTTSSRANFNPRSREGSDHSATVTAAGADDFNPRSREGSDDRLRQIESLVCISIHAPEKGATSDPQ